MITQGPTTAAKPVIKVGASGQRYTRGEVWYTYLISQPGVFKKLGTSENPQILVASMLPFPGLILLEARAFHTKPEAVAFENQLIRDFAQYRIEPPAFANHRSRKYFDAGAEIHL
jgi:hypothetical protein